MKALVVFRSQFAPLARCALVAAMLLAATLRADVVFAWNEFLLQTAAQSPRSPWLTTRAFAIAHNAMADAISAAGGSSADADELRSEQRAAAVVAAHDVVIALLPEVTAGCDALAARHLAAIGDTPARRRGELAGRHAAAIALEERAADGWVEAGEGGAALSTSADASASGEPRFIPSPYVHARPFALRALDQFTVAETRTLHGDGTLAPNTALLRSALFRDVEGAAASSAIGPWADATPLVRWNRIARQAASTPTIDLSAQARLLSALNRALADAVLVALHARATIGTWRVVPSVGWEQLDELPPLAGDVVARVVSAHEFEWVRRGTVYVVLPPTTDYPSVAATMAGAARAVITAAVGADAELPVADAGSRREVPGSSAWKVSTVAKQAAYASSLDGRHSREGCIAGYMLGENIGRYIGARGKR